MKWLYCLLYCLLWLYCLPYSSLNFFPAAWYHNTIITLPFPKLSSAYSYYGITGPKTSSATALPAHRAPPPLSAAPAVEQFEVNCAASPTTMS